MNRSVNGIPAGKSITVKSTVTDEIRLETVLIVAAEFAAWRLVRQGLPVDDDAVTEDAKKFALDWSAGRWPK